MIPKGPLKEERFLEFDSAPELLFMGKFRDSFIENVNPLKIVKRIQFKPFLGGWYPYIDIFSPNSSLQLSFLHGKVSLNLSFKRLCIGCYEELKGNIEILGIPVALCPNCSSGLYHGYWECLKRLTKKQYHENDMNEFCNDLFLPECGYVLNVDRMNPCVRRHAIGLIVRDEFTLYLMVGPEDTMEYRMRWEGGLIGIILGFSDRIMNINLLSNIFHDFQYSLRKTMEKYTEIISNEQATLSFSVASEWKDTELNLLRNGTELRQESVQSSLSNWILVNFFKFYSNQKSQKLVDTILEPCKRMVDYLINNLFLYMKHDLEILNIINLFHSFTSISFKFRQFLEQKILNLLNLDDIKQLSTNILVRNKISLNRMISKKILGSPLNTREITSDIELREFICSMGFYAIVDSNLSKKPSILNMADLIGCKVVY